MHTFLDFLARFVRSMLRLVLLLAAGVFALSLLTAVLGAVLLNALWSLITGRKPAVVTTFTRFRQASRQFRQGSWSPNSGAPLDATAAPDVVDVQSREVGDRASRPDILLERSPHR